MNRVSVITAAALVAAASAANAHPKLVSASPAENATVAKPARVYLRFSEKLIPAFSKGELVRAAMPGMPAMKIATTSTLVAGGHTLVVTPRSPLQPGRYNMAWHVVSTDTHKVDGSYMFAVK